MRSDERPLAVHGEGDLAAQLDRVRLHSDTLYSIIGVVASSPDLARVLDGIVGLLTEATGSHACFVYLLRGGRLRIEAASRIYAHLVGHVEFGVDEGLTGWVARNREPAFIRDHALADSRMKYVPELEEERFQSMVAVPVPARSGDVIGVIVLHTVAPREFDEGDMSFLAHTGALVAGAIENAGLYEQARRRVEALTTLSALSQRIAAATRREDLYRVVTSGVRDLLDCDGCQLYLLDAEADRLELAAADSREAVPPPREATAALLDLLERHARSGPADTPLDGGADGSAPSLAAPLTVGNEHLGVLVALGPREPPDDDELLRAVANQVALALRQAELIERLTEENIVRDLFEALAAGSTDVARARARAAQVDLDRAHVLIHVEPVADGDGERRPWPEVAEHAEGRLRRLVPGAVCEVRRECLRALLPLTAGATGTEVGALDRALQELGTGERVFVGRSHVHHGADGGPRGLREAADAAQIGRALLPAGGTLAYEALGAYKYLVRLPLDDTPEDRHAAAIEQLISYDERRRAQLVQTLEQYLLDRRSIAATARALFIHPNTLRQRLGRIEKLSGLDLAAEDLLSLELALKLVRLRRATLDK